MNFFITGAAGQLGTALRQQYPEAKSADIQELDITSRDSVLKYDWKNIDCIINAAAYTNVDGAETPEGRIASWQVNAMAVGHLVEVATKFNITLVHVSTDYVFHGSQNPHTENEPLSPLSSYGASKAAGDLVLAQAPKYYLLRTSWLIGEGSNFVRTMLQLGQKGVDPIVVADQVGRPTFTAELVRGIDHLLSTKAPYGIYNITNSGDEVSWASLTREIFKEAGLDRKVNDTTTAEYFATKEGVAERPLNSTFDLAKIESTGFKPKDWRDDLKKYLKKELAK